MPAGQGKDAEERFAASVEQGRPLGSDGGDLANELAIVARLRAVGADLDPTPDEKARARRRLMARLAAEDAATDQATPRTRAIVPEETAAEITSRIEPVRAEPAYADDYAYAEADAGSYEDADYDRGYDEVDDSGHVLVNGRRSKGAGRHTMPSRPSRSAGSRRPGSRGPERRSTIRRTMLVASAAVLAIIAVAGTGVFASRNALPGDNLYSVKRVAESAGLALTFDDAAKAARNLELATTRLSEVQQLVDEKRQDAADPQVVQDAITDFDSSSDAGSKMLLTEDEAHDPAKLADLQDWASDQVATLQKLRPGLPASSQNEVDRSIVLLKKMSARAAALQDRAGCSDVTSGKSDGVGPLPAKGECTTDGDTTNGGSSDSDEGTQGSSPSTGADSDDPTRPAGTSAATATPGGILPDVLGGTGATTSVPGASVDPTTESESGSTSSATTTTKAPISVPLPLLPPINIPPLLPGGRGITIG